MGLPIESLDWRQLDEGAQRRKLDEYLEADRGRGFELDKAPLMRLALARIGQARHVFIWTCHHLLTDGWSLGLLLRECLATYQALSAGRTPARPGAALQGLHRVGEAAAAGGGRALLAGAAAGLHLAHARALRSRLQGGRRGAPRTTGGLALAGSSQSSCGCWRARTRSR